MSEQREVEREQRAIYIIMVVALAPILIALVAQPRVIDGGNALILILVVLGLAGLIAGATRAYRARRASDNRRPPR